MKASSFEFRYRYWLHALVLLIGFVAPWTYLHRSNETDVVASNAHVWGVLATDLGMMLGKQGGPESFLLATNIVLGIGILLALLGAWMRTWAAAYLTAPVVQSAELHTAAGIAGVSGSGLVEDGPYRHLRNPLYVGLFFHVLALCLLMPKSGAIFTLVAIAFIDLRLIAAEEHFLEMSLGETYERYYEKVPSLWPALSPRLPGTGRLPRWGQAFLAEIYMWGTVAAFAFAGWRYNQNLIVSGVLISFGVSFLVRAFEPKAKPEQA